MRWQLKAETLKAESRKLNGASWDERPAYVPQARDYGVAGMAGQAAHNQAPPTFVEQGTEASG